MAVAAAHTQPIQQWVVAAARLEAKLEAEPSVRQAVAVKVQVIVVAAVELVAPVKLEAAVKLAAAATAAVEVTVVVAATVTLAVVQVVFGVMDVVVVLVVTPVTPILPMMTVHNRRATASRLSSPYDRSSYNLMRSTFCSIFAVAHDVLLIESMLRWICLVGGLWFRFITIIRE